MPNYFTELKDGPSGPSYKVKDEEAEQAIGEIGTALAGKVDKVAGKGLSTNDYSDTEKGKVSANAEAIEAMVNVTGAKNLLPFFVISNVIEGVTWTVDNVNNIITVDGTATNWSYQEGDKNTITLKAGQKYILSSGVDISNQYNVYIDMYEAITISPLATTEQGDIEYTPQTDKTVYFNVVVRTGATVSNVEIKPMIRPAGTDATYVPYAMTNRELTERVSGFTHGETMSSNTGRYVTALWTGYIVSTSKVVLTLAIPFAKDVELDDITVAVSTSIAIITVNGLKWINNCSVTQKTLSISGLILDISCDEDPSLTPATPIVSGIHPCTITIS